MVDPITLEVVREALSSLVREMRVTLMRTAYSSILYEGEDFSCVLMDRHAQIVAMSRGQDHPLHIVPIAWSMKAVAEKFGDDIHEGDIFLLPSKVPHSPQRPAGTVGLVVEQPKAFAESHHLRWYCKECGEIVHDHEFQPVDIGKQIKAALDEFKSDVKYRTCKKCKTVHPA